MLDIPKPALGQAREDRVQNHVSGNRLARLLEAVSIHRSSVVSPGLVKTPMGCVEGGNDSKQAGGDEQRRRDMDERWKRRHVSALDLLLP